jgi:tetratricopeptide (TPR) repeat protein
MDGVSTVADLIQDAYSRLKESDGEGAVRILREALKEDFDHTEVIYALKCVTWWLERLKRLEDFGSPFEKGGFILSQWKPFYAFAATVNGGGGMTDSCHYALRRFVFSLAIAFFREIPEENGQDPEVLLQMGRCCKGVGNFEEAARYLEQAVRFRREDPLALSELADVNALLGDTRAAKVLFREAFYLGAQAVDLESMESEMIILLREKVAGLGYSGAELAEWIPVYGCLWGVFSVKRELKPVELGKLNQSILSLENEIRGGADTGRLRPKLLNRYFRLIDYYGNVRDNSEAVEETMLKIKFIDPAIYEAVMNSTETDRREARKAESRRFKE